MMEKISDTNKLQGICKDVRKDILSMIHAVGSGHPGGSLSAVEMIVGLFFSVMNHDPKNPSDENRDRFILSKGHAAPTYYSVLARTGYVPLEELMTLRKLGSRLQGHPDKSKFSLMETTSGSLGQGISIAAGMALGLRLKNNPAKIYCVLGDGELDEGQVWESLATIKNHKLCNLITIIDRNMIQLDGPTSDIKDLEPLKEKLVSFGHSVIEIEGNDIESVLKGLNDAISSSNQGQTVIIISKTVKGKGVSFMENTAKWHGKAPNDEEYDKAIKEIG
jgi:transketolase